MTSKPNPLIEFLRGRLSWRDLPEEITLPDNLWHQMDELWQRSIAHIAEGRVNEWGGVLVLDEQDDLKLANIVEGTGERVQLSIAWGETFVGSFHTHPYADGTTGIAFSGADIADAINNEELVSIVQSGQEVYAVVRTDEAPSHVDRELLKNRHETLYWRYLGQGMSDEKAVYYTNLDICQDCGLAMYVGRVFESLWEAYRP
jgi:hypothetical protein